MSDGVESLGADATIPATTAAGPEHEPLEVVTPEHYTDRARLTHGGMGQILTARDRRLRRTVAIKELRVQSPELRVRFEREALLTARLQHPSIVSVYEAGRWPSGEPFYAMELLTGRSLDRVVAEATTLEARLGLLPHVIAVADALAYAHGQRVIHRDLKPHNVMVGEFGETVVIDWGLGKDLATTGADRPISGVQRGDAVGATSIGDVLGTPAYMAPEQAAGEVVDERTDVYAIGAILDHVLSGQPPYAGSTTAEVLEAVRRGPPPPLTTRQPGVPPDLLAVVERAMARARDARYPTARELANDLRRFQSGQLVGAHRYSLRQLLVRTLRRHRTAFAVAAAAAVVLLAGGALSVRRIVREQHRAETERALANAHRAEAEELMGFMLFDLKEKLERVGKVDLLDAIATRADAYYARRPETDDREDQRKRAAMLASLGDVRFAQGDTVAALAHHRASIAMRARLVERAPDDQDAQRDLASSHRDLGDLLLAQGDTAGGLVEYRAALAIAARLSAAAPGEHDRRRHLEISHNRVADVLADQGEAAAALAEYRTALAIAEELAALDPANATWQRDLSVSHNRIGDVLVGQGDLTGALTHFQAGLAIRERRSAIDPDNPAAHADLALSHDKVGDILFARGDQAAALTAFRAALAITERLALQDPTSAGRRRDLASSHDKVGNVLAAQGDLEGALAIHRAGLALRTKLAEQDPASTDFQLDLSVSHDRLGEVLAERGDTTGALASYRAALAISEALAARDPNHAGWQRNLGESRRSVARTLAARGDTAEALVIARSALAVLERLVAQDPDQAEWQRDLGTVHGEIAEVLALRGDVAGSRDAYRAALAITEAVAAREPSNAQWQADVAELRRIIEAGDRGAVPKHR